MKRLIHLFPFAVVVLACAVSSVSAAVLNIKVQNKSALSLNAITATSKSTNATAAVTFAALAAGAKSNLQLTQTANDCVYNLTFSLASKTYIMTAVDLCQTDVLVVE